MPSFAQCQQSYERQRDNDALSLGDEGPLDDKVLIALLAKEIIKMNIQEIPNRQRPAWARVFVMVDAYQSPNITTWEHCPRMIRRLARKYLEPEMEEWRNP